MTALAQGDVRLLETEVARRLLASRIPARLAYVAPDGTPRVLATWFHWTGEVLSMPTFLAAPHISRPAGRLRVLRANPHVAVTIDTESFPPNVLSIRGRVTIDEVEGVPAEYAASALRYLGEEAGQGYLAQIDQPGTRMARIDLQPEWVGLLDFESRLPRALGGVS
jgi:Pyridoxamine 5'-phosphate oxidase